MLHNFSTTEHSTGQHNTAQRSVVDRFKTDPRQCGPCEPIISQALCRQAVPNISGDTKNAALGLHTRGHRAMNALQMCCSWWLSLND